MPKTCPLLYAVHVFHQIANKDTTLSSSFAVDCNDECAWFDEDYNRCAMLGIAKRIYPINILGEE